MDGWKDIEQELRMSLSNVFKVKAKVKIIETSMSMYATHVYRHANFECHSLNVARDITTVKGTNQRGGGGGGG